MKKIILSFSILLFISCKQSTNTLKEQTIQDSISLTVLDTGGVVITKKVDSIKIKELRKYFLYKKDEFDTNQVTWVTPLSAPKVSNRNALFCYFEQGKEAANNFRFRLQYTSDNWLFINNCEFLIDAKPLEFTPDKVERDSGNGKICEWFDVSVNYTNNDLIEALAKAKTAKVKLNGDHFYNIVKITPVQLLNIKRSYDLYLASGGSFSSIK